MFALSLGFNGAKKHLLEHLGLVSKIKEENRNTDEEKEEKTKMGREEGESEEKTRDVKSEKNFCDSAAAATTTTAAFNWMDQPHYHHHH